MTLAGLPAVAMAYLVDELDLQAIGFGMGLYIAGTTLGGMSGRLRRRGDQRLLGLAAGDGGRGRARLRSARC